MLCLVQLPQVELPPYLPRYIKHHSTISRHLLPWSNNINLLIKETRMCVIFATYVQVSLVSCFIMKPRTIPEIKKKRLLLPLCSDFWGFFRSKTLPPKIRCPANVPDFSVNLMWVLPKKSFCDKVPTIQRRKSCSFFFKQFK